MTNPGTTNLVAWWSLDETSGTRYDSHGSNHLTDNNTVGYAAGVVGNAADFVPANNESLTSSASGLNGSDRDFTVAGWFRFDTSGLNNYIVSRGLNSIGNRGYRVYVATNDRINFAVFNGATSVTQIALGHPLLSTGTWYFFVAYHDAANNLVGLSLNGGAFNTSAFSAGVEATTEPFSVGNCAAFSSWRLDGAVDTLAFYDRVLTADEISWLYNSGAGRAYSDLGGGAVTPWPILLSGRVVNG